MSEMILKKIIELTKTVEKYNYQYYVLDDPLVPDYEYDRINHELMDLEKQYPQYIQPNSPSFRIGGAGYNTFAQVEHTVRMDSLQDVFSLDEIRDFDRRVRETVTAPRTWWSTRSMASRCRWSIPTASLPGVLPGAMALWARM